MRSWIVDFWSKPLGKTLCILAAAIVVILALIFVPWLQAKVYHANLDTTALSKLTAAELIQLQKDLITAENNARLTLAQIIGGLVVLLGLYATFKNVQVAQANLKIAQISSDTNAKAVQSNMEIAQKNAEIAEEGKLTERFSKAVELLGSEKLDVRLGGIYALERIAKIR